VSLDPTRFFRQTYSPEEVAAMLGISVRSVYRRIEDGSMPCLARIGKLLRIPIEEFHEQYPGLRAPLQLKLPFADAPK
jgi:excisionase family DNA binding protein